MATAVAAGCRSSSRRLAAHLSFTFLSLSIRLPQQQADQRSIPSSRGKLRMRIDIIICIYYLQQCCAFVPCRSPEAGTRRRRNIPRWIWHIHVLASPNSQTTVAGLLRRQIDIDTHYMHRFPIRNQPTSTDTSISIQLHYACS